MGSDSFGNWRESMVSMDEYHAEGLRHSLGETGLTFKTFYLAIRVQCCQRVVVVVFCLVSLSSRQGG